MMLRIRLPLAVTIVVSLLGGASYAQTACVDLAKMTLPEMTAIKSELVSSTQFTYGEDQNGNDLTISDLPEFCRVSLTVEPEINVEVWLPTTTWNGRFRGEGGGGYAGDISWTAIGGALRDGYAVASTDTGHKGLNMGDSSFGFKDDGTINMPLIVDFASRSLFEMTSKAKAVTQTFYGRAPDYSYWSGCSTGGRQGLMQIQRTPDAYDGVLAGAPAINWERFIAAELWPQIAMRIEAGGPLPSCKFELVNMAAVAACDTNDGVKDGVLRDPSECRFDAASLQCPADATPDCGCLTAGEVSAVSKIWDGAQRPDGKPIWPGMMRSSVHDVLASQSPFPIATGHLKWTKQDENFDWSTLSYEDFALYFDESFKKWNTVIGTDDPDISAFADAGGKLILWHGWTDQFIFPQGTIDYVSRVNATLGGEEVTSNFMRLFMAPGVNHCRGGEGADAFGQDANRQTATRPLKPEPEYDMFAALVSWVENGTAPEKIVATQYINDDPSEGVAMTRPMCVWPKVATYDGDGDPLDTSSFECALKE